MAMQLGHVHIKTREDPRKVAQFYIDNGPPDGSRRWRSRLRSACRSLISGCAGLDENCSADGWAMTPSGMREGPRVRGLSAGGRWIRTIGPA